MTPEFAKYEAESLEAYKAAGGDVSHIKFYENSEAQEKTRIPGATAAYEWPAGSSHPAKLAHFLLQSAIDRGAKLFTFCPAIEVVKQNGSTFWDVHTTRGVITVEKVIHCTNAHAALLLPQLEAYIRPNRAQAHSLVPTPATTRKLLMMLYRVLTSFSLSTLPVARENRMVKVWIMHGPGSFR